LEPPTSSPYKFEEEERGKRRREEKEEEESPHWSSILHPPLLARLCSTPASSPVL